MEPIQLVVYGDPVTAGSKRPFVFKDKNTGKIRASMAPASNKQKPWMQQVAGVAINEYRGPILTGPIKYEMEFYFTRPKSHYGTGRNAGKIKDSAPVHHTKKPDTMKLARCVEDALTGIIWKDDSQCFDLHPRKFYTTGKSRVEIKIIPI